MTSHHPQAKPPTARQQAYLRQLALQCGVTFTVPRTRAEASRQIGALKRRRPDARRDQRDETRAVQADLSTGAGDSTRIRQDEVSGYGSSATWKENAR